MKRIGIVTLIALLCALMVLGTMNSMIATLITFVVVLCIGLYPGDFGFGKEEEIHDPVVDKYFDDDEPTAEERASFIDIPEYREDR